MSYESALEAAGAVVHEFKHFGDYQGSWYALVTYKGEQGWISGSYGSCSGCDAFEAEFGWSVRDQPDYQCKLKSFGEGYLGGIYSTEQQVQSMLGLYMSDEDKEAVVWVREIAERYGVK